jgi:hypothetical protein
MSRICSVFKTLLEVGHLSGSDEEMRRRVPAMGFKLKYLRKPRLNRGLT